MIASASTLIECWCYYLLR